jgi:hypothetical protein
MGFYPADQKVPSGLMNDAFLLRPLRTSDVKLDFEAVMESASLLHTYGGGTWPEADFTQEENLADLARHQREHEASEAFTYTVMSLDESRCLGCVYVDPLMRLLERGRIVEDNRRQNVPDVSGVVRYWARQSEIGRGLDRLLFQALVEWFRSEWAFSQVFFQANEHDQRQRETLDRAGLGRAYVVQVPGIRGTFLVCGPIQIASHN